MKEQTKKNLKTAATATGLVLGTTFLVMRHIAKKQQPQATYANQPEEQNPMEGKKVVFVENENEPANADGKCGHLEAVGESEHLPTFYEKYIKRGFDVVLSFGGLVVLSPIYAATAIAIKKDDPGPVLFKQKRVGTDKSYFQLLKFRSMSVNTPKDVPTHMLKDGGITKVGAVIRKTSIDELPQLWNIFRGNMSVIGPRPALWNQDYLTAERDKYGANDVKPGLTGLAQISGRDELEIEEKAKLDGVYAKELKKSSLGGFIMDCKMFLGSVSSVLRSQGVVEGGTGAIAREIQKANNDVLTDSKIDAFPQERTSYESIIKFGAISLLTVCSNLYLYKKNPGCKKYLPMILSNAAIGGAALTIHTNNNRQKGILKRFAADDMNLTVQEEVSSVCCLKRVLITGANSYLGEAVEKWLSRFPENYIVDTIDMIGDSWRNADFSKYDVIYHVAGLAHSDVGNASEDQINLYYQVNRDLAIETARKAKSEGVKQFIFMSSMIIYSGCKEKMITPETIPCPENFYGDSKWQADQQIREMADDDFKVVVLRPPMIYGKNSKGNYRTLESIATRLPVFPCVKNQRSMLFIDNLCEFVKLMIDNEEDGAFFPQNAEYSNTTDIVQMISMIKGHKILIVPFTNSLVKLFSKMPGRFSKLASKAFGDQTYEMSMSEYKQDYRVLSLTESIRKIEE